MDTSDLDKKEWSTSGNRPRRINKDRLYPKEMEGRRFYRMMISNGNQQVFDYFTSPVAAAHAFKKAHKQGKLVFMSVGSYDVNDTRNREVIRRMGNINWHPYQKTWVRWHKYNSNYADSKKKKKGK